ncbi:prealbumin-like fold domain-containing protein [Bifidobacterium boum]|uniref:prealbumin-like fold domain-containing protein n=1 Tax=Bifidobacterium boum TaxID=78343 RepID=UPI003992B008
MTRIPRQACREHNSHCPTGAPPEKTSRKTSTTTTGGVAQFTGLKAGTYTLKESQAPDGYETSATGHTIVVGTDLPITYDGKPHPAHRWRRTDAASQQVIT